MIHVKHLVNHAVCFRPAPFNSQFAAARPVPTLFQIVGFAFIKGPNEVIAHA